MSGAGGRAKILAATATIAMLLLACSSEDTATGPTTTVTIGPTQPILFSPEGNNLNAFATTPPFTSQQVNTANHSFNDAPSDPEGWDINGQVCVSEQQGTTYLIAGEDTLQPDPPAGWGVFVLTGSEIGDMQIERVARLVPTYQRTEDDPDTYGCGVLSDGRIVVTDIGNNAGGTPNGQLTMFYPPYDPDPSRSDETLPFCKIDEKLATGQAIAVTPDGKVYLNSPRPSDDPEATAGGVYEYPGPFPTAPDAAGGCGKTDNLGSPMADSFTKRKVLAAGENDLVSPSGLAHSPNGHWYVASVINGVINEYDKNWSFVQNVLRPPAGETLGDQSFSTGTPLGLAVDPDGNLFFADIGIVFVEGRTPGPGARMGSVNRITFTAGRPNPPEVMADRLQFPDGLGIWSR
jgi:hypothetical protein